MLAYRKGRTNMDVSESHSNAGSEKSYAWVSVCRKHKKAKNRPHIFGAFEARIFFKISGVPPTSSEATAMCPPRSLALSTGVSYTSVLICSQKKLSRHYRSGDRGIQCTGLPQPILCWLNGASKFLRNVTVVMANIQRVSS
ncbi:hypothetical protein NPIL_32811 [Nephila pilipes]|uniref:Uncharacterized protein n=1 Tax=Nephila pilipes TaxID=299642 RepID=A0A8X6N9H9_NEPPI|nr:hypothetical protein NPIL_32811 [Nephila pilipes]